MVMVMLEVELGRLDWSTWFGSPSTLASSLSAAMDERVILLLRFRATRQLLGKEA